MRLILDGNSLLNAALLGGTDHENGSVVTSDSGRKTQVNSAAYGVDKFFAEIDAVLQKFSAAPRDMILVWDGKNAKARRQGMFPEYKAGRDKIAEVSEQINIARDLCTEGMLSLGAQVAEQVGYEADDVIGYLCSVLRGERNVVVTSDGDLSVLVDDNTDVWRLGELNKNPYGPFPHSFITLYKALVGDSSDKIPGAKGFGDVAWVDLVRVFGVDGLAEFQRMVEKDLLGELAESVPYLKALQKVIDNKATVAICWRLAKLYTDEINTMRRPLRITAGMVTQKGSAVVEQYHGLRRFYGTKTLVTADNFQAVYERLAQTSFQTSPFIALDIETSSTDASDEWIEAMKVLTEKERSGIDVLGHELTGMSLTFGENMQHTIYMSVDHKDTDNITVDQCREMLELVPQRLHIVIQNRSFEFSVLYRTWGDKWADNGWHGFIPNAVDSVIGASYVDENRKAGLKDRSLHHLRYTQATYEGTTSKSGPLGTLPIGGQLTKAYEVTTAPAVYEQVFTEVVDEETGEIVGTTKNGKLLTKAVTEPWTTRQYKMNELTALEAFDYGCDDTICTAALHTHYKLVMDIENTWNVYMEVEQYPEYLTSLAFVQGLRMNTSKLTEMSNRDDAAYQVAWGSIREFLIRKGWEGTTCPEFEGGIEPSDAKLAVSILLGGEFSTKKRKLNGIAFDISAQFPDNAMADLLAAIVERDDVPALNDLIRRNFTGEPEINFGSPKQMQNLFYRVLGMTPRIVNKMTDNQRAGDPAMASAFKKRRAAKSGKTVEYTPEELDALISKSSTDDDTVGLALALDDLSPESRQILAAFQTVKEIGTRRGLYYVPYRAFPHWRDGHLHPSLNQARAVTRRYSASAPNVQQMPSKGEGLEFREVVVAHHSEAVVVSLDWNGQELRLGAELSGDVAMTSCYVGDNKRDMHSLTAVAAATQVYGKDITYDQFMANRKSSDPAVRAEADDLRGKAKTTNFSAQYGAFAESVSIKMKCTEEMAQQFLDAREAAFPGIVAWDAKVKAEAGECGYALTMMGARRHLAEALSADNSWDRAKAERQVGNFWIQGSAGEMTKLAMSKVWRSGICTGKYDAVFYFPVHDELVFSVHKDQAADFVIEAHAIMVERYADMKIPLESSIAIGRNFACEIEVGMTPDRTLIEAAVSKLFQ